MGSFGRTPKPGIIPGHFYAPPGYPKVVTPRTPNPEQVLAQNIQVGTCCSGSKEAMMQASHMALTPPLVDDPHRRIEFPPALHVPHRVESPRNVRLFVLTLPGQFYLGSA